MKNKIMFSLDTDNNKVSMNMYRLINKLVNGQIIQGAYKGVEETSIMTDISNYSLVLDIAYKFNQDSILVLTDNSASLVFSDRRPDLKIGTQLVKVSKDVAINSEAYSLINGQYYIVE
jgi:hypothetical protein